MIQRVVLSAQVKEELLDDIMSGRYKPGDRLVESQIAKRMGISQSPVREALRDMVAMRFVEVEPHKGARVRKIDQREVLEIYPVRASLEELAGQLAVKNAAKYLGRLEEAIEHMVKAFAAGDVRTLAHWDASFHRTILEASGNQILIETWNSLMIDARTFVTLNNLITRAPEVDLAGRHYPIIEALQDGDPMKCGTVMRSHVEEFGHVMHRIFDENGGGVSADYVEPAEPVLSRVGAKAG